MGDDPLQKAFASTRAVLAAIGPDALGDSTPCRSWTVGELINHTIAAPRVGAHMLLGQEPPADDIDFAAGDFVAAYDESVTVTLDAFAVPGVLEKTVQLPFAEVPGAFLRQMITTDQFTHGWDLARATGQPTDLAPGVAERLLAVAKMSLPDAMRGPDGQAPFGPAVVVADDAPAADRLAGFMGRTV